LSVPACAGLEAGQHQLVVVECRQDDRRRQRVARRQRVQHVEARHPGHAHVEQYHIGLDRGHDFERLGAVGCFGHDANVVGQLEQRTDALPDQSLVVDQAYGNRLRRSHRFASSGNQASSANP
jgi:hypothetical protein